MAGEPVAPTTVVWLTDDAFNSSLYNSSLNDTLFNCNTDQPTLYFITQVLYALVCIVGLFGNSLVIYVVLRFSKMQTVTNMYIVNLAIADECFLIGIPFLIATMSLQLWPFGDIMCKVYMTTTSINQFTSSIFLTIMSADRYVAVCHPISAPKMRTPAISKVVSVSAWVASGVLMIPVFMYSSIMNNSCNIIWPEMENLSGQTAFTLYSFILGFAIPLVLILCFYVLVIRKLRTVGPKNKSKEKKKSHRKVTKLVLTVITVYVVCWLPYWITQVALIYTPPKQCQSHFAITIFLLVGILSYSNSAMNPILYAFLSDNFKKSFLKACTCAAGKVFLNDITCGNIDVSDMARNMQVEFTAAEKRPACFLAPLFYEKLPQEEDVKEGDGEGEGDRVNSLMSKDVNATLHMENSVFPRGRHGNRGGSERGPRGGGGVKGGLGAPAVCQSGGDQGENGPLVSRADHSTAVTSRSNVTVSSDVATPVKNGVKIVVPPAEL